MTHTLAADALDCASLAEYESAIHRFLDRDIGCDTFYLGAAVPGPSRAPLVAGVADIDVASCEAQGERYWPDRLALNGAALARGGVVEDVSVFSVRDRDARPFYREVVRRLGIRVIAASVLMFRGAPLASIYLGRTSRGATFRRALRTLRRALPTLALGYAAHARSAPPSVLTVRERELFAHVTLGLTNAEIAALLGTSPNTVKRQISSILDKCEVTNRTELVALYGGSRP